MTIDEILELILSAEGGYVNDPRDPGGETKFGISKRSYPGLDIRSLTLEGAKGLYVKDYWTKYSLESFPPYIQYSLLDFTVNSGYGNAIRALQRTIGVADDGIFGIISSTRLESLKPIDVLIDYNEERLKFLRKLSTFPTYGNGWTRRVMGVIKHSVQVV
jgi:lysozyme family protein